MVSGPIEKQPCRPAGPLGLTVLQTVVGLLAVVGLSACVTSDPTGTYRQIYQTSETGDTETSNYSNLLEVGVQENVGADFQVRASERLIYTDSSFDTGTIDGDQQQFLNQPSIDTILTAGLITWTQGFEILQVDTNASPGADNDLNQTEILEEIKIAPIDLPLMSARFSRRTSEDDQFLDREDLEALFEIQDARGPWSWLYSLELDHVDDRSADVEKNLTEHIFRGGHQDDYLDGKLRENISVFVEERRTTSHVPTGALPPGEVFPNSGLSIVDTTPQIAILNTTPSLIDGDATTSTGINIGGLTSGGQLSWNIGAGLGANRTVELLLLNTDIVVPSFLVNQFSFSVWVSDDNNFWTLVTGAASFTYEDSFQRFRIRIPDATGRFFKVVNTASPPGAGAISVTELRLFAPAPPNADTKFDTRDSTRNVRSNLSWNPIESLTLGHDILVQQTQRDDDGVSTQDELRIDNGLSALWSPIELFDWSVRASAQMTDDDVLDDDDYNFVNTVLDFHVLETLDVALTYSGTERKINRDLSNKTSSAGARITAQLLETLFAEVSVERNEQDDILNSREIDRDIITATVTATMTPSIDVSLALRNEEAQVRGVGAGLIPDPTERTAEVTLRYRPSDQISTEVQLEYKDTFSGTGLDQRYRLDWIPFPEGSVDILLDYLREEVGQFDTASDRALIQGRWTMNPRAFFEFTYSALVPDNMDRTDMVTVSLNVSL